MMDSFVEFVFSLIIDGAYTFIKYKSPFAIRYIYIHSIGDKTFQLQMLIFKLLNCNVISNFLLSQIIRPALGMYSHVQKQLRSSIMA